MADWGIKVAKPGYDATTTADVNLLFSSSWPSLQITLDTVATSTSVPHGLSFPPLAFCYSSKDLSDPYASERRIASVDSTNVTAVVGERVVVYNLDISKNIEYPDIAGNSTISPTSSDYGIRIVKDGRNIESTDMRDYILHTRCQSPMVKAVVTEESAVSNVITYEWDDSSLTWLYGLVKNTSGVYRAIRYGGGAYPQFNFTTSSVSFTIVPAAGDMGASIVILRDPFFAATNTEASY